MPIVGALAHDRIRKKPERSMKRIVRPTTKEGHAGQLSPGAMLLLLLMKHTGRNGIEEDHLSDLCQQAIALCGSIERAIQEFEAGRLRLEKLP
jgi:hypothetical protein